MYCLTIYGSPQIILHIARLFSPMRMQFQVPNTSTLSFLLSNQATRTTQHVDTLQQMGLRLSNTVVSQTSTKSSSTVGHILSIRCDEVPQLASLCRFCIRKYLNKIHGGRSVVEYITQLPLPSVLHDYLLLKHEFRE